MGGIFLVLLMHGQWIKMGRPILAIDIREQRRNNSVIYPLCVCGTIQPPQVAVLINSTWAGVKPLLGSSAHI